MSDLATFISCTWYSCYPTLSIIPAKSRRQDPGLDVPLAVQHPYPGCNKTFAHSKAEFLHFKTWSSLKCPKKLLDCCTREQEQGPDRWLQDCGWAGCMLVRRNKVGSMRTKCRNNELMTEVQPWSCTVILCFLALSAGTSGFNENFHVKYCMELL